MGTVNSVAMNIGVDVYLWIIVFSSYMPRSGIAGPYDNSDCHLIAELVINFRTRLPANHCGNYSFCLILKLKFQCFGHLMQRADSLEKNLDAGKDWGQEEKVMTKDEMIGWHHQLNGHKFEQAPGDGEGQESLACCSPWGHKESNMTEWLSNNNKLSWSVS